VVLEGGYDLGAIRRSMAAVMPVLTDESTPAPVAVDAHPLATAAVERLRTYWPGL
jgi:acetoin utilization deacetylase AcuC-like enzyme